MRTAHIGRFKPLCDFDWAWPKRCDRAVIDTLMTLEFLNVVAQLIERDEPKQGAVVGTV